MLYSDKLKAIKINDQKLDSNGATLGLGIDREQLREMILGFCTADDAVGVKHESLFDLFDEYCMENGYPIVNRLTLGRAFCSVFGLCRKRARRHQQLCWVYIKKPED